MTDMELDRLMRRALADAIGRDYETIEAADLSFKPSWRFQQQMKDMLKDPPKWVNRKMRPMWQSILRKVAIAFIVCSLGLGSAMVVSPTARAAVLRWISEWNGSWIVVNFLGEPAYEKMPQYTITDLPEGYEEDVAQQVMDSSYGRHVYINTIDEDAEYVYLKYFDMQEAYAIGFDTEDAEIIPVEISGCEGQLYQPHDSNSPSTVSWANTDKKLYFVIDAAVDGDTILRMAESVSEENAEVK